MSTDRAREQPAVRRQLLDELGPAHPLETYEPWDEPWGWFTSRDTCLLYVLDPELGRREEREWQERQAARREQLLSSPQRQ